MKRAFYFLLFGLTSSLLSACEEFAIAKNTPACIRTQTEEFARGASSCKTNDRTTGASVKEYRFQNQMVYVLDMGNCIVDGSAEVIGENCQRLGFLGGFAGSTTINGESFSKAEYKRTIWQN